MQIISRNLVILVCLIGVGCDVDEGLDELEVSALDDDVDALTEDVSVAEPSELAGYTATEAPVEMGAQGDPMEIAPPPSEAVCGGYWDYSGPIFQGCGSCKHKSPPYDYERDGNLAKYYKRWCWSGGWGCPNYCEGWQVYGDSCYGYDTCN